MNIIMKIENLFTTVNTALYQQLSLLKMHSALESLSFNTMASAGTTSILTLIAIGIMLV